MKYISWNVNGIRACQKKGFAQFVAREDPDLLCLQEVKAERHQAELNLHRNYHVSWYSAEKKGYSGTAVLSKVTPLTVTYGLGDAELDREGRVITLEFADYFLVNVYTPNSKDGLQRLAYRHQTWDPRFLQHLRRLEQAKPVACCGDLNVAHREIDLAHPADNHFSAGFTDEERAGFENYLRAGFIDTFREFEPGGGHYTWWSYRTAARERNIGWRIDYWLISPALRPRLQKAWLMPEVPGSDHCPVGMILA
ncbi:MAG: exodeoxyribonuclease III [Verrucomicrobiales bacterium]|jgi:exodeoxyribonuclease-3|nr:exodeoxyribonuclease III [Verrucomicrobiales bacterium]